MLTTRLATSDDFAAIAALWAARAADTASWISASMDAGQIAQRAAADGVFHVASDDSGPVGFAMTARLGSRVQVCTSATTAAVFYAILGAVASYWLPRGVTMIITFCRAAASTEKTWTAALRVMNDKPIGFEPLQPGADPSTRVPVLDLLSADLAAVQAAAAGAEGG